MTLASLVLAYAGWLSICAGMSRHTREILRRDLSPVGRRLLRATGSAALGFALGCATLDVGLVLGLVQWLSALSVTALALALLLPLGRYVVVSFALFGGVAGAAIMVLWRP